MTVDELAKKVEGGGRLSADEALELYTHAPTALLGRLADEVRRRKHPEGVVTYIIDRNVNYTNVCVARCKFCAFYRPVGSRRGLHARLRRDLQEDRRDDRRRRRAAAAPGRPQPRHSDRVVRGSLPRGEAAVSGVPAARALAARGHPHLAAVAALRARGHRAARCAPGSTAFPAAARRSWSTASARSSTATTRRPPTSGSA